MRIPRKCPKCGHDTLKTETGTATTSYFKNGVLINKEDTPLERRLICNACLEILNDGGD